MQIILQIIPRTAAQILLVICGAVLAVALYISISHPIHVLTSYCRTDPEMLIGDVRVYKLDNTSMTALDAVRDYIDTQVKELHPGSEPGFFSKIFNPLGYVRWAMRNALYKQARETQLDLVVASNKNRQTALATTNSIAVACEIYVQTSRLATYLIPGVKLSPPPFRLEKAEATRVSLDIIDWFLIISALHIVVFSIALIRIMWRYALLTGVDLCPVAARKPSNISNTPADMTRKGRTKSFKPIISSDATIDLGATQGWVWYYDFSLLEAGFLQIHPKPACWLGAPMKRFLHHSYWMVSNDGEHDVRLVGNDPNLRFIHVFVPPGQILLVDASRLAAFAIRDNASSTTGPRSAILKVFEPAYWLVGHVLPVVFDGDCEVVLKGRGIQHGPDCGYAILAGRVMAVAATQSTRASAYQTGAGPSSWFSQIINAFSFTRVLWHIPDTSQLVVEAVLPHKNSSFSVLRALFHLVLLTLLYQVFRSM